MPYTHDVDEQDRLHDIEEQNREKRNIKVKEILILFFLAIIVTALTYTCLILSYLL